jgi:radical SAM protein with 4Fe4S-binding SPASM domain
MKLFYDKKLIIKKVGKDKHIIYSPISNKRIRVNGMVKIFLKYVIENKGDLNISQMKDYLSKKINKNLEENEISKHIETLKQLKFLYETEEEIDKMNNEVEEKIKKIFKNQKLITAYLHLTMRCDFNCVYCYNRELASSHKEELDTYSWFKIIEHLKTAGVKTLNITGGEPLVREDTDVLIKKARDYGFNISLLTNGSLLLDKYDKIVPYVDKVFLSLDSNDMFINSKNRSRVGFSKILKLIEEIAREFPQKLTVRSVVTKNNMKNVEEFHNFLRERYNIKNLIKNLALPNKIEDIGKMVTLNWQKGKKPEEIEVIYNYVFCGAGRSTIAISPNGDIYPCQLLMYNELKIGNVLNPNWLESLKSANLNIFPIFLDKNIKCNSCAYKYYCGGGCPGISYKLYKNFNSFLDFLCPHIKEEAKLKIIYKKCEWENI